MQSWLQSSCFVLTQQQPRVAFDMRKSRLITVSSEPVVARDFTIRMIVSPTVRWKAPSAMCSSFKNRLANWAWSSYLQCGGKGVAISRATWASLSPKPSGATKWDAILKLKSVKNKIWLSEKTLPSTWEATALNSRNKKHIVLLSAYSVDKSNHQSILSLHGKEHMYHLSGRNGESKCQPHWKMLLNKTIYLFLIVAGHYMLWVRCILTSLLNTIYQACVFNFIVFQTPFRPLHPVVHLQGWAICGR